MPTETKKLDKTCASFLQEKNGTWDFAQIIVGQNNTLEVFEPSENPVLFSPSITKFEKFKTGSYSEVVPAKVIPENSKVPPLQRLRSLFKNRNLIENTIGKKHALKKYDQFALKY